MVAAVRLLTLASGRGQRDFGAARRGHRHIGGFEINGVIGRQRHARVARLEKQDAAQRKVVDLGERQPVDVRRRVEDRERVALALEERRDDLPHDRHRGDRARRDDRRAAPRKCSRPIGNGLRGVDRRGRAVRDVDHMWGRDIVESDGVVHRLRKRDRKRRHARIRQRDRGDVEIGVQCVEVLRNVGGAIGDVEPADDLVERRLVGEECRDQTTTGPPDDAVIEAMLLFLQPASISPLQYPRRYQ